MPLIKAKKILITGGAGFIGSHLIEALISHNQITIYDNFHRNSLKFTKLLGHRNLKIIKGDIMDAEKVASIISDHQIIIHLAAIAGVESTIISPLKTLEVNLMGTYNLLKAINGQSKKIERFIFFSTSEVYGPFVYQAQEDGMTTQGRVSQPRWAYSTSKIAGEHWAYAYFDKWHLPVVIVRPFNIYGQRQVGEGAIHNFIVQAIQGKPIKIFGSGHQIRSWCYIDDFVQGIMLALTKPKAVGQIYNIGTPEATLTVCELAKTIREISGSKSKITFHERDYPDIELRIPSINKAQKELGYEPQFSLKDGLHKTIAWYKGLKKGDL